MIPTLRRRAALCSMLALLLTSFAQSVWADGFRGGHRDALGPKYKAGRDQHDFDSLRLRARKQRAQNQVATSWILNWNEVAIDASGLDHTPVAPGETRVFGEQLGPARASRAMAIVHIAMFEVVNAIHGGYESYVGLRAARGDTSLRAAIAQAARDTLVALFPSQAATFDGELADDLRRISDKRAKANGTALGRRAAAAILALRANDGSQHAEPVVGVDFITSDDPGMWRQDPVSLIPIALGAHWPEVRPFVMRSAAQFRAPAPPAIDSMEYAIAFEEVKRLGGCGKRELCPVGDDGKPTVTPTERTDEQTHIGIFWAYDGVPSLCAPPRLYNQIAVEIATLMRSNVVDLARVLALANVAMADAGIAVWESKFFYEYWRPITGIREADPAVGPLAVVNGAGARDQAFIPLGGQASNLTGPNFTPPFPAYPSGHAGFGGALFQTLRRFYGTDHIAFTFVSDEFDGVTRDNQGNVRPFLPRSYRNLSEAEEENGQSRIYLGIHWFFDKTEAIAQGRQVADYVLRNTFLPVRGKRHNSR